MTNSLYSRIWLPAIMLITAVVLLTWGEFGFAYKIFEDPPQQDDPFLLFEKITESQMVIESTYGGVSRTDDGELYFNYDRTEAMTGAKPCPT